jgi:uncharacterized membrane protein (TIGR02234 family)
MDPMPAQKPARPGSREKFVAALLAAAGAGLVLASVGRSWAHGTLTAPVRLAVSASGSDLSGVPYALGLAGLAGTLALFAVRRVGRYAVGAVLLAAGVGTVIVVAGKLGHLDSALLTKAAAQAAIATDAQIAGIGNSAWPYLTIAGGILIAMSGAYTLLKGGSWTGLSSRYDRAPATAAAASTTAALNTAASTPALAPATGTPAPEPTARDLWDALNRGADPTL